MDDPFLVRQLRRLRRTVEMLRTELHHVNVDEGLLADIEMQMESGLATDPRCSELREPVDAVRESLLTPRPELHRDGIRACDELMYTIERAMGGQ